MHGRGRRLADADADLPVIARVSAGFTGADLANLLNEAALLAVRERATAIMRQHLQEAVDRVQAGPNARAHHLAEEKCRIACHEAGHAVVAAALGRTE